DVVPVGRDIGFVEKDLGLAHGHSGSRMTTRKSRSIGDGYTAEPSRTTEVPAAEIAAAAIPGDAVGRPRSDCSGGSQRCLVVSGSLGSRSHELHGHQHVPREEP